MTKYRTIVADPPWPIKWTPGSDKIKGGAWWNGERVGRAGRDMAYETMSVDAIGEKPNVKACWRYFCGCCWNLLRERQAIAASLLEVEEGEGTE